jgi:Multimeric flavodoxin WrbA
MTKKVLVISASLRGKSNSDRLADAFIEGAKTAGHEVEKVNLKGKKINFCLGCLACYKTKTGHCVQKDDADDITQKFRDADVICLATPIYYYNISGQLKVMLDRVNPLLVLGNRPWDIYLLTTAEEKKAYTDARAVTTIDGWSSCFPNAAFKEKLFAGGFTDPGAIEGSAYLEAAKKLGAHA